MVLDELNVNTVVAEGNIVAVAENVAFPVPLIVKLAKGVLAVPVRDARVHDNVAPVSISKIPELATFNESGRISFVVLNVPDAIRILFALIAVVAVPVCPEFNATSMPQSFGLPAQFVPINVLEVPTNLNQPVEPVVIKVVLNVVPSPFNVPLTSKTFVPMDNRLPDDTPCNVRLLQAEFASTVIV